MNGNAKLFLDEKEFKIPQRTLIDWYIGILNGFNLVSFDNLFQCCTNTVATTITTSSSSSIATTTGSAPLLTYDHLLQIKCSYRFCFCWCFWFCFPSLDWYIFADIYRSHRLIVRSIGWTFVKMFWCICNNCHNSNVMLIRFFLCHYD